MSNNSTLLTLTTDYLLGTAELVSVVTGLLLNPLTIPHFFHHRKQFTSFLYLLISVTDILILLSCFPTAISMLNRKASMFLENRIICLLSGFIFNVFSRVSVFLIAMLSVARTIQLVFPFTVIKPAIYLAVFTVYFCLNVCLAGLPLVFSETTYYYTAFFGQCTWGINELSFVNSTDSSLWYGMTYTTIILPWLVPGLVVVLSCVASVTVLLRSSINRKQLKNNSDNTRKHIVLRFKSNGLTTRGRGKGLEGAHRLQINIANDEPDLATAATTQATITILIMTLVYILFNVPCWLVYCYLLSTEFNALTWTRTFRVDQLQLVFILVGRVSVALNSASNPVVYLCRMKPLRARLRSSRVMMLIRRQMVRRGLYKETNSEKTNVTSK